jgi:large subunit ribosomal protein L32
MRRANHDKITAPNLSPCPSCGEPKQSHRVCSYCGAYRGREVMEVEEKE